MVPPPPSPLRSSTQIGHTTPSPLCDDVIAMDLLSVNYNISPSRPWRLVRQRPWGLRSKITQCPSRVRRHSLEPVDFLKRSAQPDPRDAGSQLAQYFVLGTGHLIERVSMPYSMKPPMTTTRATPFKAFAPFMVGVLFLCHIMGILCLMVPSTAMGAPSLQNPPSTQSMMAADLPCADAIHSSGERTGTPDTSTFTSPTLLAPPVVVCSTSSATLLPTLQKTGPPLFTLLSTFRI